MESRGSDARKRPGERRAQLVDQQGAHLARHRIGARQGGDAMALQSCRMSASDPSLPINDNDDGRAGARSRLRRSLSCRCSHDTKIAPAVTRCSDLRVMRRLLE